MLGAQSLSLPQARRAVEVCNVCRYCEGLCAVFPAMELRREFAAADLAYLANLCHACRACYYACQYAPPHAFAVNVPKVLAEVRNESYATWAWPAPLAMLFRRNGQIMALAMALGVGGVLLLSWPRLFGVQPLLAGQGFYNVVPYAAMVGVASVTLLFSLLALGIGLARFWQDAGSGPVRVRPLLQALRDAATLRYLGGGGPGCNDRDEGLSTWRRRFHHVMTCGLLLCLAATALATVYHHVMAWPAPYPLWSLPVAVGSLGGVGVIAGSAGLLWLRLAADREPQAATLRGAEFGLLTLLMLIALTGLLLLGLRGTAAMGVALAVHLGLVLALFVTLPYSKFVHGLYRTAALIRYAGERPSAQTAERVADS
jgi:citrate/tricarballylate utilization protein